MCLSLLVCFAFAGCKGDEDTVSSTPKNTSSKTETAESKEETSSKQETSRPAEIIPVDTYGDLLKKMKESGKQLAFYGKWATDGSADGTDAAELTNALNSYRHKISFVAYSIKNDRAVCYNTESDAFCACTVKAAYVLYALKEMEKAQINPDETYLTYEKKHHETGTGDMQYSPYGTKFTIRTTVEKTMSISDNVGYMMLVDRFGRDGYNKWISALGCESLQIKPTVWALHAKSHDLAVVWREIYNYFKQKENNIYSKLLYDCTTNTANGYAAAALKDVDYSHKQGNNRGGDWHSYSDAGIVWRENEPYIISVITDAPGPSDYDAQMMAKIITYVDKKITEQNNIDIP